MGSTIERPAWATTEIDTGLEDGPIFRRRLRAHANAWQTLQTLGSTGLERFRFGYELTQAGSDPVVLESDELPLSWLSIADPATARAIAASLLEAADEWESVMGGAR